MRREVGWVAHHGDQDGTQEGRGTGRKESEDREMTARGGSWEWSGFGEPRGWRFPAARDGCSRGQQKGRGFFLKIGRVSDTPNCSPRVHPALPSAVGSEALQAPCRPQTGLLSARFPGWSLLLADKKSSLMPVHSLPTFLEVPH